MKIIVETYRGLQQLAPRYHFNVWGTPYENIPAGTYEIDPKHLFDDQVNTTCGKRVHEWADYMNPARRSDRWGHYIVNYEEFREYLRGFYKCGYCGHTAAHSGWCDRCRGSEYLTPKDYPLLNLRQLTTPYTALSVPEDVIASIEAAQHETAKRKAAQWSAQKISYLNKKIAEVVRERDFFDFAIACGLHWKMLENCIYYGHTDQFNFGWRTELTPDEATYIQDQLGQHDWPVTFKVRKAS